ncbi:tyrosine-type recombinase/integrase [Phreatobacter stygius]|uniref:Site-specific integrase n=1 Tax=Phreatobacter stygius TaxID=1940610 RepID=A0A4D7B725_9HYPH|nr:tyrosine-type recombinase/integrase [Phreatobacter stygius]QCI63952.1 site-specific integrase [Phreatobacter stygius]
MPVSYQQATSLYTPRGLRKYLTADERARFLRAAWSCPRADLRALCLLLVHTGCRISEALALTAASIEPASGFIAVRSLKKRKRVIVIREVPAPPDLLRELATVHALDDGPKDRRLWPLSRSRAWSLVKQLMREAGIAEGPQATPKGLRHGFGVHAIQSGIPLNLVQRWLGHARMETTAIYLQVMGDEERQIAARMWIAPRDEPVAPRI